jgi:hypothetical protein
MEEVMEVYKEVRGGNHEEDFTIKKGSSWFLTPAGEITIWRISDREILEITMSLWVQCLRLHGNCLEEFTSVFDDLVTGSCE